MCGLAFGIAGIAGWLILGTGFAIVFGATFGLQFLLLQGGVAYISHYILRYFLLQRKYLPWRYSRFLDYATKRILLRKVGGGYIFLHRIFFEYFADLAPREE
jgi:hypothetical protein